MWSLAVLLLLCISHTVKLRNGFSHGSTETQSKFFPEVSASTQAKTRDHVGALAHTTALTFILFYTEYSIMHA